MSALTQIIGSILLAVVPVLIWGGIFFKKNPEDKRLSALTFIVGALAVFPILIYKFLWQYFPWLNAFKFAEIYKDDLIGIANVAVIPLSVVISFMIVGLIEEIMKLLAVKVVDDDSYRSIDDVIEFFIIAALGFSFTENILYFYNIWIHYGADSLFVPFILRSSFSTLAHLIFSGILGYYYGTAYFAKPVLEQELKQKRKRWTIVLHKLTNIKKDKLFHEERMIEGLLISVLLHAAFNIFLELNWTFMIMPFLWSGYLVLNHLFNKKENHKRLDKYLSLSRLTNISIKKQ